MNVPECRCSGLPDVRPFDGAAATEQSIPAEQRNPPKAGLLHRQAKLRRTRVLEPAEEDDTGRVLRHRVKERQWVGSWVEGAADGVASELRVGLLELVGDRATVACVVDHEGVARTEVVESEPGECRRLDVVRGREADVVLAAGLVDRVQVTLFPVITGQNGAGPNFPWCSRLRPRADRAPNARRQHPRAHLPAHPACLRPSMYPTACEVQNWRFVISVDRRRVEGAGGCQEFVSDDAS